jgi:cell division protein FtsW
MKQHQPDYILIGITAIIVVFGLVMLSSASMVKSQETYGQPYYYLKHQLLYAVLLAAPLAFALSKINYKFWKKIAFPIFIATVLLLIAVFLPGISFKAGGATRWLRLGPLQFQPSELAKLAVIIYLAALYENRQKKSDKENFLTLIISLGIIAGLIVLQPNIGTAGVICLTAAVIYFAAGAPLWQMATLVLLGLGGLFSFINIFSHAANRFQIFLHPEFDPQGIGYQINQALLAIGSGGFFGRGLGQSLQKFNYLPEVIGDSIFAIIAEELGFIGVMIVVALFLAFAFQGFKIAKNAPDNFSKLLAIGITSWILIQSFVNIAAISGSMPLTGVPFPFISYGGSGLIITLAAVGILVNISRYTNSKS